MIISNFLILSLSQIQLRCGWILNPWIKSKLPQKGGTSASRVIESTKSTKKNLKVERETGLVITRRLALKSYSLILDKTKCSGCGICVKVCPRDAIHPNPVSLLEKNAMLSSFVDIDEQRCQYCRVCSTLCPFGALGTFTGRAGVNYPQMT